MNNNIHLLNQQLQLNQQDDSSNFVPFTGDGNNLVEPETINDTTTISEAFPWLVDDEGNHIDYNRQVSLFEAVKIVSVFLKKKYDKTDVDSSELELKLSQILKTEEEGKLTILEIFNRVSKLYNEGQLNKELNLLNEELTESISDDKVNTDLIEENALGTWGDMTINELMSKLKDLNFDAALGGVKFTVHAAPAAVTALSYGVMLRTYINLVHNRPYPININAEELRAHRLLRRHNLPVFALLGAPVFGVLFKKGIGLGFKNMFDIELNSEKSISSSTDINELRGISIFLILNKINNKIPNWLKWLFRIIILSIIVLKILGFSSLWPVLSNIYFIKIFLNTLCSLFIIYQLLNIFILYQYDVMEKRSEVLPEFILNKKY